MISNQLFDLALTLIRERPHELLAPAQRFACRRADGTLNICSFDREAPGVYAFFAYDGPDALRRFLDFPLDDLADDYYAQDENDMQEDCLKIILYQLGDYPLPARPELERYCAESGQRLSRKALYPNFRTCKPYRKDRVPSEAEQAALAELLEAALYVVRRLRATKARPESLGFPEDSFESYGFPPDIPLPLLERTADGYAWSSLSFPAGEAPGFPSPRIGDAEALARLREAPKRGAWACRILVAFNDAEDEDGNVWYPLQLAIADNNSGALLAAPLGRAADDYAADFLEGIRRLIAERGRPVRILAQDERTRRFFAGLAEDLGIKLVLDMNNTAIDNALDALLEEAEEEEEEPFDEKNARVEDLVLDEEALREASDDLLIAIADHYEPEDLSDAVSERLAAELERRGLV